MSEKQLQDIEQRHTQIKADLFTVLISEIEKRLTVRGNVDEQKIAEIALEIYWRYMG